MINEDMSPMHDKKKSISPIGKGSLSKKNKKSPSSKRKSSPSKTT